MLLRIEVATKNTRDQGNFRRKLTAAVIREAADLADECGVELIRLQTLQPPKKKGS